MQDRAAFGTDFNSDRRLEAALYCSWDSFRLETGNQASSDSERGLCVACRAYFHRMHDFWEEPRSAPPQSATGALEVPVAVDECAPEMDIWMAAVWTSLLNCTGMVHPVLQSTTSVTAPHVASFDTHA